MSHSPERISSYRRHFEEGISSSYQVRVSSPSPIRRGRAGSAAGYPCGAGVVRRESAGRTMSATRRSRMVGAGAGAGVLVCLGPSGERPMDLDAAAAENEEFKNTRTTEKEEMIVLNDRLAVYIDKVRSLEQQNKLLEAEIEAYQNRFVRPSGLRQLYEEQLRELKKIADQMKAQRDIAFANKDSTAAQLAAMKLKYEEAIELRRKAEAEIEAFRPDVDQATSSRIALEKRLEQLEVEIEFLKRVHQQEIDELMRQIYAAHVTAQSAFSLPDLAGALKQIQNQYDDIAAKNLQEMDSWYKNKFEDITKKTSRHVDHVRSYREGIGNAKKDIQNKDRDLEALKTKNEALELKIREMQEKYRKELEQLQVRIETLQIELKTTKEKIALHLREYQDLLNVKMSLEIEITTYRKLVEGEDLRLAGMMQTLSLAGCSMSAIGSGMSFGEGGIGGVGGTGGGGFGVAGVGIGGYGGGAVIGGGASSEARMGAVGVDMGVAGRGGVGGMAEGVGRLSTGGRGVSRSSGGVGSAGFGAGGGVADSTGIADGLSAKERGSFSPGNIATGLGGLSRDQEGVDAGKAATGAKLEGSGIRSEGAGLGTSEIAERGSNLQGMEKDTGTTRASTTGTAGIRTSGSETVHGGVNTGARLEATGSSGVGMSTASVASVGAGDVDASLRGIGPGSAYTGVTGAGIGLTDSAGSEGANIGLGGKGARISETSGLGGLGTSSVSAGSGVGAADLGAVEDTGSVGRERSSRDDSSIGGAGVSGPSSLFSVGGTQLGSGDGKSDSGGRAEAVGQGNDGAGGLARGISCGDGGLRGFAGPISAATAAIKGSSGSAVGFGSDQYGSNIEPYAEQAVEVTERRTVLIRTVKHANEVMEMDHQEQTYTIRGAADESDNE